MWARLIGAASLAVGLYLLEFRLVEYLLGGFIGEMYVGGVTIIVFELPLVAVGVTAVGLGVLTLWLSRRAVRS